VLKQATVERTLTNRTLFRMAYEMACIDVGWNYVQRLVSLGRGKYSLLQYRLK
jgi:hypothetical protein